MHFLDIADLSEEQIQAIFTLADQLKLNAYRDVLRGKTFILFFPESSIRTRITFEKAVQSLGGSCILFPPETLDKREELQDVVQYIANWADGVIARHSDFAKIQKLAEHAGIPVINAMTSENHPCEIVSDVYSIRERRTNYRDLTYTFVGPAGNIARSWMQIATVMDLTFNHVCLPGNALGLTHRNYTFHTELDPILGDSDIILTDSLRSEYQNPDYYEKYQITLKRLQQTPPHSMLNPCPPFFRGEEVSTDAIASDYFVGYGFKQNLLYAQQAIILYCSGLQDI